MAVAPEREGRCCPVASASLAGLSEIKGCAILLVAASVGTQVPTGRCSSLVGPEEDTWRQTGADWWRQTLEVTWRACQLAGRDDLGVTPGTQREFLLSISRTVNSASGSNAGVNGTRDESKDSPRESECSTSSDDQMSLLPEEEKRLIE